mmetsp:Transcript_33431/g.75574  ORF Transcript_33431/g.75574 Transcript_33431/m.75574 type:complete len:224 (+) Transcript_33431:1067-1738(+)
MSSEVRKMGSRELHPRVTVSHTDSVSLMRPRASCQRITLSLKNSMNLPMPKMVWSSIWSASRPSTTSSPGLIALMSGDDLDGPYPSSITAQFFSMAASLVSILSSLVAVSTVSDTSSVYRCRLRHMMSLRMNLGLDGSIDLTPQMRASMAQCRGRIDGLWSSFIKGSTTTMFLIASSTSRYTCHPFITGFSFPMARRFLRIPLFCSSSASVSTSFQSLVFQSA